jgi:hypothetical protein
MLLAKEFRVYLALRFVCFRVLDNGNIIAVNVCAKLISTIAILLQWLFVCQKRKQSPKNPSKCA